ncbi:MAG: hypothetical protein DRJ59_04445 [Thermoprotei archaeon]|mgnify:CR=1 FL=1|nr:MAG: hypothetical protein DRJ59_04445 [Thermoprotei archaeon]
MILTVIIYTIVLASLRKYRFIESVEPLVTTIIWTVDDVIAIDITIAVTLIGIELTRLLLRIISNEMTNLRIFHLDKTGGWAFLGHLAALNSMMVDVISGI